MCWQHPENTPLNQLQQLSKTYSGSAYESPLISGSGRKNLRLQQQTINEIVCISKPNEDNRINLEMEWQRNKTTMEDEMLVIPKSMRATVYRASTRQKAWRRQGIDPGDREEDDKIDFKTNYCSN